jgi:hypothetical protein
MKGNSAMRAMILAAILGCVGLAPYSAVAADALARSDDATIGQRQPSLFRVQPTVESVREGLALKGPHSPAELGLKNAIEKSANDLREKMIICRGC